MQETAENLRELVKSTVPLLLGLDSKFIKETSKLGAWGPKELLGHLIDSANNNHMRIVRLVENPSLKVTGYIQDKWVSIQNYKEYEWRALVMFWENYNLHMAHIIEFVPSDSLRNEIIIDDSEPITLSFLIDDYLEHTKHHLNQVLLNHKF